AGRGKPASRPSRRGGRAAGRSSLAPPRRLRARGGSRGSSRRHPQKYPRVRPTSPRGAREPEGRTPRALCMGGIMKKLARRVARLGLCFCGLGAALLNAQEVVRSPEMPSREAVTTAWTTADKASARPMPLREVAGAPMSALASSLKRGVPGSVDGNPPASTAAAVERMKQAAPIPEDFRDVSPAPEFGAGSTVWYAYPPPSSLYVPVLDYVFPVYPHTAVGKLFF